MMNRIACVFPGQGSQFVGMGRDVYDTYRIAKETFEVADDILGFDLSGICFDGPEENLRETRYTQLAILVHSVAVWRVARGEGVAPDYVAGHSVGEYSALVASGALSFPDALRLVKIRAGAMYAAGVARPGAMAALIGMPEDRLAALIESAGAEGVLAAANYNSPAQVVISGEVAAVEKAIKLSGEYGARRAIRLNVSGAFHSPLMKAARDELASALKTVTFSRAEFPVISNVGAVPIDEPGEIANSLERQLTNPVLWRQSMQYLLDRGIGLFVEIGPGNVLCGLMKRIDPKARCVCCSGVKGLKSLFDVVRDDRS
jgi:[acyl-carrier-protein] S-malonyltransferase